MAGAQVLGHLLLLSQVHQKEADLEVEQLEVEQVPIRDAGITSGSFTWCTTLALRQDLESETRMVLEQMNSHLFKQKTPQQPEESVHLCV